MAFTVVTVVGARPQFIKAAPVSRALHRYEDIREVLVHTGQHYDDNMSGVFFNELNIPQPAHSLNVGSASHGAQTGRMLEAVERVLLTVRPDLVLVYGDTNSTLAGGLAGAKLHIPVAHVEAGLRSFNRHMPEEINRVLTDHLSDILFAPTASAVRHLSDEGIASSRVEQVGDVMYDAALYYGTKAEKQSLILQTLGLSPGRYVLATIHRAENTDVPERLCAIMQGLERISRDLPVVMPLHPRTRKCLSDFGLVPEGKGMRLIEPVGYLDMVMLEKHATLVATDSGGVQKEAFFYSVPCATFRNETEWTELLELGWNRLVPPTSAEAVEAGVLAGLQEGEGSSSHPYGDGHAAERIAHHIAQRRR